MPLTSRIATAARPRARDHRFMAVPVYPKQPAKLMALLAKDDVLVVTRLDRLARSTRDLLNLLGTIGGMARLRPVARRTSLSSRRKCLRLVRANCNPSSS